MPLPFLKLAIKAKELPEVAIALRVIVGLLGVFVLAPVVTNLLDPAALSTTDWIGLVVFAAVGAWLLRAALRGRA